MSRDLVLNDAARLAAPFVHTQAPWVAPILSGALWRMRSKGPWPNESAIKVTVLGTAEGVVRFRVNEYAPDERLTEEDFRRVYEYTDKLDQAEDLRARFETWARGRNWKVERYAEHGGYTGQYKCERTQFGWGAFVAGARGYCT